MGTALLNHAIVSVIKSLLIYANFSYEDLIFATGQASSADSQKNLKTTKSKSKTHVRVRVNNVEFELNNQSKLDNDRNNDVLKLLKEKQNDIASLKSKVRSLKKPKGGEVHLNNQTGEWARPKCDARNKWGNEEYKHCFIFDEPGHVAWRCPGKPP